jgi:hypothetical protein
LAQPSAARPRVAVPRRTGAVASWRFILLLAIASTAATGTPARAQIAAAIGKPLPSPDLAPGTLSVRVVAGSPSSPVIGTDVTLLVSGTPRIARTDSAGRAHFKDLPAGAQLQAKVVDEDKKEVASETFSLPGDSGARLMLTTRPWNPGGAMGGGGGAPMAGGAMPNPRQMSGEPRPEANDAPGTFTVRLTYDDFKDAAPIDVPVALVGYAADNSVTAIVRTTDKEGRAQFTGLDRTGATAYFALTLLPRGTGVDRLISTPAVLDSRGGVRLILSGEKRASSEPNLDDLSRMEKQAGAPPAGKVQITLEGGVEPNSWISLVDAQSKLPVGRAKPSMGTPDPSDVQASVQFTPRSDIPPGSVEVIVHGGADATDGALADVSVKLAPVGSPGAFKEAQTGDNGRVTMKPDIQGELVATVTINGRPFTTKPFDLSSAGGVLEVEAHWASSGKPQAMFDLVPRPGQIVYAETTMHGNLYRTIPFQPVSDRGTRATLFIFPRLLFTFSLTSRIDDEYLAVNGRFELSNNSWIPYVGGPDGIIVPLPRGFKGGLVAEKDQGDVALEPTQGFRIVRPIAPGRKTWHGAFSLPVEDGKATWALDLPFGAFNSGMEIQQVPGMTVQTPPGVDGRTMTVPQGTFFVLPQISILPRQSMVMSIAGLPAAPAWRVWLPRIAGVLVVLLVLAGIAFALFRTGPTEASTAERTARRRKLLDELVELEKDGQGGKSGKRKERILAELEKLWEEGEGGTSRPTS